MPYVYTCGKETTTQETDPVSVPPPAYFSFVNSHNEPSAQTKPDAEKTTITAKNRNKTEDVELGQSEDGLESVKEFCKRQIHATISVVVGTPIALALGCCLVYAPDLFVFLMVFWILILTKGPLVIMGAIILFFLLGSLFGLF